MRANQRLIPGQAITSPDGRFRLILQTDSNLVVYQGSRALWSTNTVGVGAAQVIMQADGNLVIYDTAGRARWSSGTFGRTGAAATLQSDGNFVIYANNGSGPAVWDAGSWRNVVAAEPPTFSVNGVVMGKITSAEHMWGPCEVIDYNVGLSGYAWGWFLRSRIPGGTFFVIRSGMWGWYRANDGINRLGCPTSDEYAYGTGARQNFQKGMIQWTASGGSFVAYPTPVRQTVSDRLADVARGYIGQWGGNACRDAGRSGLLGTSPGGYSSPSGGDGQCRAFANCIIYLASNKTVWPTNGTYAWAGGRVVTAAEARRGDVVQIGDAGHTVIVLENRGAAANGARNLLVVDSNFNGNGWSNVDELVREHAYTAPSFAVYARYEQLL